MVKTGDVWLSFFVYL